MHYQRMKRDVMDGFAQTFPIGPFLDVVNLRAMALNDLGYLARNLHRGNGTVAWHVADKLACAIRLNPISIWPDWVPDEPQLDLFDADDDAA